MSNISHNKLHSRKLAHYYSKIHSRVHVYGMNLAIMDNCGGICDPDNGTVLISSSTEGGVATYFCDDGYELEGNTSRECLPDGQWSGNEAVCKGIEHLHIVGMYRSYIIHVIYKCRAYSTIVFMCYNPELKLFAIQSSCNKTPPQINNGYISA